MKWFHFIFIPMWVFESLTAMGYEACDPMPKGQIRCENPWEVALYQYEVIDSTSTYETYERVSVIQITIKRDKKI